MQYSLQFLPLIAFYVCYQFFNLMIAAFTMAASSSLVYIYQWFKTGKHHRIDLITLIFIWIFSISSMAMNNEAIFKWKPTAVFWLFSTILIVHRFFRKKSITFWMLGDKVSVPMIIWRRVDVIFSGFFFTMGTINIYVMKNFNTATWVNYKLFGSMILTFIFLIGVASYISIHSDDINE